MYSFAEGVRGFLIHNIVIQSGHNLSGVLYLGL